MIVNKCEDLFGDYSIPIVHISILVIMPYNLHSHGFVMSFQIPSMSPPTLFFFIKMVFLILVFLYLHINFRMSLLISAKIQMAAEVFSGTVLNRLFTSSNWFTF